MGILEIFLTTSVKIPWKLPGVHLPHTVCPSFVYLNADKLQYFNSLSWVWLHLHGVPSIFELIMRLNIKPSLRALQSWQWWIQSWRIRWLGEEYAIVHSSYPFIFAAAHFQVFQGNCLPTLSGQCLLPLFHFEWAPSSKSSAQPGAILVTIIIVLSHPMKC